MFMIEDRMVTLQVDVNVALSHARSGIKYDRTFTIKYRTLTL